MYNPLHSVTIVLRKTKITKTGHKLNTGRGQLFKTSPKNTQPCFT